MTTKTDHHAVMELKRIYTPAERGIVNAAEEKLIREVLELNSRNDIELQNIRDTAVMMYRRWADALQQATNISAVMVTMDAMSAICCIIDQEKFKRGLDV